MNSASTTANHDCANDEHTENVRDADDIKADGITNAFETEFHMSGVKAYLEYYQLRA